jgi:hypothetical protein
LCASAYQARLLSGNPIYTRARARAEIRLKQICNEAPRTNKSRLTDFAIRPQVGSPGHSPGPLPPAHNAHAFEWRRLANQHQQQKQIRSLSARVICGGCALARAPDRLGEKDFVTRRAATSLLLYTRRTYKYVLSAISIKPPASFLVRKRRKI